MMGECDVVRAGAQRFEDVMLAWGRRVLFRRDDRSTGLQPCANADTGLGIPNIRCRLLDEAAQRGIATDIEIPATGCIVVQIEHRLSSQLGGMGVRPDARADYADFLAVPTCKNECSLGFDALPIELTERASLGQQSRGTRMRIPRTEHPRIVMNPTNDPRVRFLGALQGCDHVV